jgi:hypothetical protein
MLFKMSNEKYHLQMMTAIKHDSIGTLAHHPNRQLASIIRQLYQDLILQLSHFEKCIVSGLCYDIQTFEDNTILVRLNCCAMGTFAKVTLVEDKCISGHIVFAEQSFLPYAAGLIDQVCLRDWKRN